MAITAIIFSLIGVALKPFSYYTRYKYVSMWAKFNIALLGKLMNLRYVVEGKENIIDGTAIILSKHQSTWETMAFQCIFPPQMWVLKKELLYIPFFGWGLGSLDPIAINRSKRKQAMEQIIEQGQQRLDDGRWVVIFPEGTRIPAGRRGRYKIGGARLSEATGYPIIPVAHNAGEYWPKGGFLKKPGIISVRIGKPIYPNDKTAAQINAEVEHWIEAQMEEITSQALKPIVPHDGVS